MRDVILVSAIDFRFGVKYHHILCSNMFDVVRRQFDFLLKHCEFVCVWFLFFVIFTED